MAGKNWNVFTKRVLVEKHIRGIMYENPGGSRTSLPPLPMPTTYNAQLLHFFYHFSHKLNY